jgi:predicted membrane protein
MNWKKIAGRVLTAAVAVALAVFAIVGVTPPWWAAVLSIVSAVATVVIGEWEPPK